jgi:hypothetical protein
MIAPSLAGKIMGSDSGDFVIAEWRDGGGPPGQRRLIAPPHIHHGDDEVEAGAGCGVLVPRGTAHTYWNPAPYPVRYLPIMTANIHRLILDFHAMQERTPAALAAVFAKHNSTLLP